MASSWSESITVFFSVCFFERGLLWELMTDGSLGEEEELSSSLSFLVFWFDKRGRLLVLPVRARAAGFGDFGGRLLVEMTDGVSENLTGFMVTSFPEDWF